MPRKLLRVDASKLAVLVLVCGQSTAVCDDAAALDPGKTHAVIVGVLHWQSPSISTFSSESRKDRELHETLLGMGVPKENMALVLDEEATLERIRQTIKDVSSKAGSGDTLIFYYAGHGTSVDGQACLYNYDVDAEDKPHTALTSKEIANILKSSFHGKRVLMFADCCYSGALATAAEELYKHGIETATITSASDADSSTSNWTFTHLLIEMLRGNPDADQNDDGTITLTEAAQETSEAMKYRDDQDSGHSRFGISPDFRLSSTARQRSQARTPEPYKLFDYVQVRQGDQWTTARLVDYRDGIYAAEIQHYATREIVSVDDDNVRKYQKIEVPRPEPLELRKALAKARVDGKYANLLEIFDAEADFDDYGEFSDFGHYPATGYAGQADLPEGYWVYVYPNWYIWKDKVH